MTGRQITRRALAVLIPAGLVVATLCAYAAGVCAHLGVDLLLVELLAAGHATAYLMLRGAAALTRRIRYLRYHRREVHG